MKDDQIADCQKKIRACIGISNKIFAMKNINEKNDIIPYFVPHYLGLYLVKKKKYMSGQ